MKIALDVLPSSPLANAVYRHPRNTVSLGKRQRIGARTPDGANIVSGHLGVRSATPPLGRTIPLVVQVGPEEQMVRSYAGRIVAFMEYVQPIWNRAVSHFVAPPVGKRTPPHESQPTVSTNTARSPLPATVRLRHLRPEPLIGVDEVMVWVDAKGFAAGARHPRLDGKRAIRNLPRNPNGAYRPAGRYAENRIATGCR